jgi:hypothetical protein
MPTQVHETGFVLRHVLCQELCYFDLFFFSVKNRDLGTFDILLMVAVELLDY